MNGNQKLVNYLRDIGVLKTPEIISAFEEVDREEFPGFVFVPLI